MHSEFLHDRSVVVLVIKLEELVASEEQGSAKCQAPAPADEGLATATASLRLAARSSQLAAIDFRLSA